MPTDHTAGRTEVASSGEVPVCGHPNASTDGRCQRTVPFEGVRCPHHRGLPGGAEDR